MRTFQHFPSFALVQRSLVRARAPVYSVFGRRLHPSAHVEELAREYKFDIRKFAALPCSRNTVRTDAQARVTGLEE